MNKPCPKCGEQPELVRVGSSYWLAQCKTRHMPFRIQGHTMKTQRAALDQWDRIYADSKTPNVKLTGKPGTHRPESTVVQASGAVNG